MGVSWYNDAVSKGATVEEKVIDWKVNQNLFTGSVAYFGNKFELLTEGTFGINKTDTTGSKNTLAAYLYAGYKVTEKLIPYVRLDDLQYQNGEIYFDKEQYNFCCGWFRFQIIILLLLN